MVAGASSKGADTLPETAEQIVEAYLRRMAEIRSTGGATSETSFYGALEALLNTVGTGLKPRVIANGQLRNQGAGHPDFGLYTQTQCRSGRPSRNIPRKLGMAWGHCNNRALLQARFPARLRRPRLWP
jgi:hypothetical protein